ncbi:MAG: hypothetical protein WCQ21_24375 [Verrucomicrobiota bacterium]
MKRADVIRDIHGLELELAALEDQYGLRSPDFYHCYRAGEQEQTRDFIRWSGYYEAKLEREARYRPLAYEHLRELRRQSGLGAVLKHELSEATIARIWRGRREDFVAKSAKHAKSGLGR